ncbi:MAG: hypothetical protein PVG24_01255 [Gammaproteobacteria bacterium]|jgi:hypothetical protein
MNLQSATRWAARIGVAASGVTLALALASAQVQTSSSERDGRTSVGRGWPVPVDLGPYDGYPEEQFVGSVTPWYWDINTTATGGDAPDGITPLETDLFTSKDFYADRDLWMDPRYYRCNSPIGLDSIRGDYTSGPSAVDNGDPATAAWGHCDRDYPREAIVSPYPFRTAEAHYAALLAETHAKGGPTQHTRDTLPDWNGGYTRNLNLAFARGRRGETTADLNDDYFEPPQWVVGWANQMPTILSLLKPEYQQRFVQQMYHKANTSAAVNPLSFCWPEGLMRWWTGPGAPRTLDVTVVPGRVQFLGGTGNAIRHVQIGREFDMDGDVPRLGPDVRQWLGETIGFWDGNALITWTSNIQGWFTHGMWEHSSQLQLIEIWSERLDSSGEFLGLEHETIFYDPEVFVEPVRDIRLFPFSGSYSEMAPYNVSQCIQTIFLGEDGRNTQVAPGTTIPFEVRDLYDRPWAQIWEEYFEDGMSRPEEDDSLGGFR